MTNQTCAVIDSSGNVINVIMADPAKDEIAGHTLVASDTAIVGGSYANGVFSPPAPPAFSRLVFVGSALAALAVSDRVSIRCAKKGVSFASWLDYDAALVAIVNGTDTTSTTLPTKPAYPAGS